MAEDPTPTTLRRQLGARLRQLRLEQGKTAQQVADDLGFSISKVSRIESGDRAVQEADAEALTGYFGLDRAEGDDIRGLARQGRRRRVPISQPAEVADDLTIQQTGFLDLERDATWIREYNGGVIPGLLQSRRYMAAAIRDGSPGVADELVDNAVEMRRSRQAGLRSDRRYDVLVDESVLWRRVGSPEIMQEQIEIIREALEVGRTTFRVVPLSSGAHPAVNSMFVALRIAEGLAPDIVFVEGLGGHTKIDRSEDVRRFDRMWSHLASLAERSESSDERLSAMAAHWSSEAKRI